MKYIHPIRIYNKVKKTIAICFDFLLIDKMRISLSYRNKFGQRINWKNPQSYNEKIQWMKLYDRNPLYTVLADKYSVKDYVANIIGDSYIIPTIGVWERFEDIDFDKLPDQFVLKCTHDSASTIICRDKKVFDYEKAHQLLNDALDINYYRAEGGRQWAYKNIPHRIIAEKYVCNRDKSSLIDYKFHCFDGCCKAFLIASDRESRPKFNFYYRDLSMIPCKRGGENADNIAIPDNIGQLIEIAERLADGLPHVRVDLYDIDGTTVKFGEYTFYPAGGMEPFVPEKYDYEFGEWYRLSRNR